MTETVSYHSISSDFPAPWESDLLPQIRTELEASNRKVVILDDDPTGTQTVHGIPVLTDWNITRLVETMRENVPGFYILTNSRALLLDDAIRLNQQIGTNLKRASREADVDFTIVSRSDSTLRGHFPGEVIALAKAIDEIAQPILLVPFFFEGGRLTLDSVHYIRDDDTLLPVSESPYAQDPIFGYRSSNLKEWVIEKSNGIEFNPELFTILIEDIRRGGPELVRDKLLKLPDRSVCAVDSAVYRDQEVFVLGLLQAEKMGGHFIYRTAASFVRVRLGLSPAPLLTADDLNLPKEGAGLYVVGSHVPMSTVQADLLKQELGIESISVDVEKILSQDDSEHYQASLIERVDQSLSASRGVLLATSRDLILGATQNESQQIGQRVSAFLCQIIKGLSIQPRYIVAKGGITASDLATDGLNVERALVLGQILPGVPVWQLGKESKYPGGAYIVFPGNVGPENALIQIRAILEGE
jgi:uncharacterized protein YgbK (DUF1537 family)